MVDRMADAAKPNLLLTVFIDEIPTYWRRLMVACKFKWIESRVQIICPYLSILSLLPKPLLHIVTILVLWLLYAKNLWHYELLLHFLLLLHIVPKLL